EIIPLGIALLLPHWVQLRKLAAEQDDHIGIAVLGGCHRLHHVAGVARMVVAIVADEPSIAVVGGEEPHLAALRLAQQHIAERSVPVDISVGFHQAYLVKVSDAMKKAGAGVVPARTRPSVGRTPGWLRPVVVSGPARYEGMIFLLAAIPSTASHNKLFVAR